MASAIGIDVAAGSKASCNLEDAILAMESCRNVQRARPDDVPGNPKISHRSLEQALDVVQRAFSDLTQRSQNGPCGFRGRGNARKPPQPLGEQTSAFGGKRRSRMRTFCGALSSGSVSQRTAPEASTS